jgi:Ran GTPase-activating protein (RanGAP) involved in mRNA processing and transport
MLPSLPMLKHADLSRNKLTETSVVRAQDTARLFPQVHSFELQGTGDGAFSDEVLAPLRFYLTVNAHTTEEAREQLIRAFTNDGSLEEMCFSGYRAEAPWLLDSRYASLVSFALRQNTHVKVLRLVDCNVTDDLMGSLLDTIRVNSSIVHLDLSQNALIDVGLLCDVLLQRQVGLKVLSLDHNNMAVCSARALASMLRTTEDLEELNVQENSWGRVGATIVQSSLQSNRGLRKVELAGRNVPASVVTAAKYAVDGIGK